VRVRPYCFSHTEPQALEAVMPEKHVSKMD
jgi:hypothetical protein